MQGKDFILYEHERILAEEALRIVLQYSKTNRLNSRTKLQKTMEVFHLLVFLKIAPGISQPIKILPHEPLDVIVQFKPEPDDTFWCGIVGVEVTTCFGAYEELINNREKKFSPGGHPDIDAAVNCIIENEVRQKSPIKLPKTRFFCTQFLNRIEDKQGKEYKLEDISKKLLLIVTGEPSDSGCPVTGSWFEKSFKLQDLGIDGSFDKICVLNYFSSGKDNGPTACVDLLEEQKLFDSLLHSE